MGSVGDALGSMKIAEVLDGKGVCWWNNIRFLAEYCGWYYLGPSTKIGSLGSKYQSYQMKMKC